MAEQKVEELLLTIDGSDFEDEAAIQSVVGMADKFVETILFKRDITPSHAPFDLTVEYKTITDDWRKRNSEYEATYEQTRKLLSRAWDRGEEFEGKKKETSPYMNDITLRTFVTREVLEKKGIRPPSDEGKFTINRIEFRDIQIQNFPFEGKVKYGPGGKMKAPLAGFIDMAFSWFNPDMGKWSFVGQGAVIPFEATIDPLKFDQHQYDMIAEQSGARMIRLTTEVEKIEQIASGRWVFFALYSPASERPKTPEYLTFLIDSEYGPQNLSKVYLQGKEASDFFNNLRDGKFVPALPGTEILPPPPENGNGTPSPKEVVVPSVPLPPPPPERKFEMGNIHDVIIGLKETIPGPISIAAFKQMALEKFPYKTEKDIDNWMKQISTKKAYGRNEFILRFNKIGDGVIDVDISRRKASQPAPEPGKPVYREPPAGMYLVDDVDEAQQKMQHEFLRSVFSDYTEDKRKMFLFKFRVMSDAHDREKKVEEEEVERMLGKPTPAASPTQGRCAVCGSDVPWDAKECQSCGATFENPPLRNPPEENIVKRKQKIIDDLSKAGGFTDNTQVIAKLEEWKNRNGSHISRQELLRIAGSAGQITILMDEGYVDQINTDLFKVM